jgi:hypothetical protein
MFAVTGNGDTFEDKSGLLFLAVSPISLIGQGTKHARAEILAQRFPAELGVRLPSKRLAWASEDSRLGFFATVVLALMLRPENSK